jgi:anti-sigma regulatory factor (Ser/Thr protein kinase)
VEWSLPAEPQSAGRARRYVCEALTDLRYADVVDVAELLVSELVTNALLHAGTDVRLRVIPDVERVRIEVADRSPIPVVLRRARGTATTGRGLALVDALAAHWGSRIEPDGKIVWFELAKEAA